MTCLQNILDKEWNPVQAYLSNILWYMASRKRMSEAQLKQSYANWTQGVLFSWAICFLKNLALFTN